MVVAAQTGVAAINAGGVTLHSLFQLPMGLYLPETSRLNPSSVKTDSVVKAYSEKNASNTPTDVHLRESKREYQETLLRELFDFRAMNRNLQELARLVHEHPSALSREGRSKFETLVSKTTTEIFSIAEKFVPQLHSYFLQAELPEENEPFRERLKKAGAYFSSKLDSGFLSEMKRMDLTTDDRSVLKRAGQYLQNLEKEVLIKHACFASCQNGFSASSYIKAKTTAELDSRESEIRSTTDGPAEVLKGTPHPDLYRALLEWREVTAEELDVNVHEVLPTRSLQELVRLLPMERNSLKGISGIGKSRLKRFGGTLLLIVREYCTEKDIAATTPQLSKASTKRVSFDLFKAGKTVVEIAAQRNLAVGTIEGHLAYFIARGDLDISEFLTKEQVDELTGFFREKNTTSLAEAKAHFGERFMYGQLRMVVAHLKSGQR